MTTPVIGLTTYREVRRVGRVASSAPTCCRASTPPRSRPPAGCRCCCRPWASSAPPTPSSARLDGLVVSGGADIDPARYGAEPHPHTANWRPDRDDWEAALLDAAEAVALPVLGVCRGMQLMAVHAGGHLHQHHPELVDHRRAQPGRRRVRQDPGRHGGRHPRGRADRAGARGQLPPPPVGGDAPRLRRRRPRRGRHARGDGDAGRPVLRRRAVAPRDRGRRRPARRAAARRRAYAADRGTTGRDGAGTMAP